MSIIATVQVRMGSSRLPGKALLPVAGKPVLGHLLDRLALARRQAVSVRADLSRQSVNVGNAEFR